MCEVVQPVSSNRLTTGLHNHEGCYFKVFFLTSTGENSLRNFRKIIFWQRQLYEEYIKADRFFICIKKLT